MWLDIKTKNHKIRIVYKNINWENYKWSRKDGLSDIPISAGSDFNVNVKNNKEELFLFIISYWLFEESIESVGSKVTPYGKLNTDTPNFLLFIYFRDFSLVCLFSIVN
jgi:hypothetical protein